MDRNASRLHTIASPMRSAQGSEASTSRLVPVRLASPGSALIGGTVELEAACEGAIGGTWPEHASSSRNRYAMASSISFLSMLGTLEAKTLHEPYLSPTYAEAISGCGKNGMCWKGVPGRQVRGTFEDETQGTLNETDLEGTSLTRHLGGETGIGGSKHYDTRKWPPFFPWGAHRHTCNDIRRRKVAPLRSATGWAIIEFQHNEFDMCVVCWAGSGHCPVLHHSNPSQHLDRRVNRPALAIASLAPKANLTLWVA